MLKGYDFEKKRFLVEGFKKGFPLFSAGQSIHYESPNLLSGRAKPQVVDQKIAKELDAQRLAGPFETPPFPFFRVSPLEIVLKKTPGDFRMIYHLSYPKGKSVNDGISWEHSSVHYADIDKAIRRIKQSGVGSFLAKTDVKSAFQILLVNSQDYYLLDLKWKHPYYYDKCMPMGCSSSCKTFEAFSTAVEWLAQEKLSLANLLQLLDDFYFIHPPRGSMFKKPAASFRPM